MDVFIAKLSEHLFWDTDRQTIDVAVHKRYIIQRILTRGNLNDFELMNKYYDRETLINEIEKIRDLNNKSANFAQLYFSISKDRMQCYTQEPFQNQH
ncbi:MAG: hypothetical protein ACJAT1_000074 [Marivirga sp.]|jgi:hypothetical protein